MPTVHEFEPATLVIHDDGLLEFIYRKGVQVDLNAAQTVVKGTRAALDVIRPYPTLVNLGRVQSVTREARSYFADSDDNMEIAAKVALIAGNPVARIVGNFFLGLNRPAVPIKLFGDSDVAKEWLRS